jgi:MoaA/NifB/PqqE/SkfB family radical SAM enzyme
MTDWYCPFPFKHVFVDSSGLSPCCNTISDFGLDVSIDQYVNHPKVLNLQKQFLAGEKPTECKSCLLQENIQSKSMRLDGLEDYKHEIFNGSQIDFVHFSQSNICNFKCRSCGPQYSHGIAQEIKQNPELSKFSSDKKFVSVNEHNHQWIVDNLSSLKRLLITGGEPTVMPEVKKIFELVHQVQYPELNIMMTTNCSWTDDFWYDCIKSMPNLHITASLDGVGSVAELVRHGTAWKQVEHNIQWLSKHAYSLDINTVISCLNINNLYPLLEFCRKLQIESQAKNGGRQGDLGLRHQFSVATGKVGIDNFPDHMKSSILEHLHQCLQLDLDHEQYRIVQGLIVTVTNSQFNRHKWDQLVQYHSLLDKIRDENHLALL